jgi:tetratricopeptide (TPR) repeat protein
MEEKEFLDIMDHPSIRSNRAIVKWRILSTLLLGILVLMLFPNCSLPKIVVLKDPLTPEEHLNLGLAYEKKGLLDSAIQEYKLAAKKLTIAYLYLGNAHFLKNELGKAETYYKKMIKKDSQNADAHNNLAWLYYIKRENLDVAERYALRAIELNPLKDPIYRDTLEKIKELKKQEFKTLQ